MLAVLGEENNELKLRTSEKEICIKSSEAQKIRTLKEEESLVSESKIEQYFFIFSLTFRRGDKGFNKWKLSDGDNIFPVTIEDEDFLQKIDNRTLSFRSGDIMKCRIRTVQYQKGMCFRTEMIVEKVLDYNFAYTNLAYTP